MRILMIDGTGIISTGITRLLIERGDDVVLYNCRLSHHGSSRAVTLEEIPLCSQ